MIPRPQGFDGKGMVPVQKINVFEKFDFLRTFYVVQDSVGFSNGVIVGHLVQVLGRKIVLVPLVHSSLAVFMKNGKIVSAFVDVHGGKGLRFSDGLHF